MYKKETCQLAREVLWGEVVQQFRTVFYKELVSLLIHKAF